MKFLAPEWLRYLDRHLLVNHPILWILRIHWIVYVWMLGLASISVFALVLPITDRVVGGIEPAFFILAVVAFVLLIGWTYFPLRFTKQVQGVHLPREGSYLLAGYIFIAAILGTWPYTFVKVFEGRVRRLVAQEKFDAMFELLDERQRGQFDAERYHEWTRCIRAEVERACLEAAPKLTPRVFFECSSLPLGGRGSGKDSACGREPTLLPAEVQWLQDLKSELMRFEAGTPRSAEFLFEEEKSILKAANAVKYYQTHYAELVQFVGAAIQRDGLGVSPYLKRSYYNSFVMFGLAVVTLTSILLAWMYQAGGGKSLLATLALVFVVSMGLAFYERSWLTASPLLLGVVILVGVYSAVQSYRSQRRRVALVAGMNLFTLVVAWIPAWICAIVTQKVTDSILGISTVSGIAILLVFAPGLQRSYITHQAKPE